jgi:enoyl-CoA hydratase/carnithine racemase
MILNCDLVVASDKAQFALPEVKRGVVAIQGGMFSNTSRRIIY